MSLFYCLYQEFLLANNDANMWAVGCSLMATFMSSITILGVSSEIYTYGIQFVVINISYGIFTPLAAHLYLPVFFKLRSTSAYEVRYHELFNCLYVYMLKVNSTSASHAQNDEFS